jgi:5-methylcytosine-specific restriction endonuclease McrA
MLKYCYKCKTEKPINEFNKNRRSKDGHRSECRKCCSVMYAKWRARNLEKARANSTKWNKANLQKETARKNRWAKANPEKKNAQTQRRRAMKRGNGGSYTAAEWQTLVEKYNYTCLRCGKQEPEIKLTIDHVLPLSKGGNNTIDNIQPLCKQCNSTKNAKFIDYRKQYEKDR